MSLILIIFVISALGLAVEFYKFKMREAGNKGIPYYLLLIASVIFQILMVIALVIVIIITYIPLLILTWGIARKKKLWD